MNAVRFQPAHLDSLKVQLPQALECRDVRALGPLIAANTQAWTVFHGEQPILCGGIVMDGEGGLVWALVAEQAGPQLLALTRMVRRFLSLCPRKIDTWIKQDFTNGHRWAELFGFKRQELGPYGVDGSDYYHYTRDVWPSPLH